MRKVVAIVFLVLLNGCSSDLIKEEPIHELFSSDKYNYSLLVVDENREYDIGHDWGEKHSIRNFNTVRTSYSLEDVKNSYKFLELDKSPAFVVFDMKGVVFKTYSEDELITFLKENEPNK